MIARVYPIMRLPRNTEGFDYLVPDNFVDLGRGQVVLIPFRSKIVPGVVARVQDKTARGIKLKFILKKDDRIQFSDDELSFFEWMGFDLAQSISSILYSALPSFPKQKKHQDFIFKNNPNIILTVPKSEFESLHQIAKQLAERHEAFAHVSDIKRMATVIACYLREKPDQKCIILAPTQLDALRLHASLRTWNPFILNKDYSLADQFQSWRNFRNSKNGILIGTKSVLSCTDDKTTTLFVIRSSHQNHGHHENNPRYDARTIAREYGKRFQTNVFFLDVAPRVEDFITFNESNHLGFHIPLNPVIVDMEQEYRAAKTGAFIGYQACASIKQALVEKKRVLCVLNKKFRSKRYSCEQCKKDILCPHCQNSMAVDEIRMRCIRCQYTEPLLLTCPICHQHSMKEHGFGNQKIAELLKHFFPQAKVCSIDKEHPDLDPDADVVLATSYYLEQIADPFHPDRFAVVILLDADVRLFSPTFRAVEETLYDFEQWRSLAYANRAEFFVQTHSPSIFHDYLQETKKFFLQELAFRCSYHQPPFVNVIRLNFSESEKRKADILMNQWIKMIQTICPDAIIKKSPDAMQHYFFEIRFQKKYREKMLSFLRTISDRVIIDTHADSI